VAVYAIVSPNICCYPPQWYTQKRCIIKSLDCQSDICENCRYFDQIACMLDRPDRHTGVPGQRCQSFALLSRHAAGRAV